MIGQVLRIRYELVQSVHDGPIFALYTARDRVQNRDVHVRVLKEPFAHEPDFVEALKKAVHKTVNLQHPGLERIWEVDEDEQTVFMVGDATNGAALTERIKKLAPFSVPVSVGTAIGICEALSAVHSSFQVHGDLGPHNICVTPEGEARVQMAGIWEAYSASATAGAVVLPQLAPYLAPEISKGGMPSPASDVYAVGVILFELLAGRKPYIADHSVAVAMMHATEPTPEVRTLNPSVPVALNEIVKKAMAKEPEQRYRSAGDLLSDLRMVRDALRFGRSLTWPLQAGAPEAEVGAKAVAPAASAKPGKGGKKDSDIWIDDFDEPPADIPTWLKMTMVFFGSLVVFMVGGWILFNLSKPKMVTVPVLSRLTLTDAEARLKSLKLSMRVNQRQASDQFAADTVISSTPVAGSKVYEGNTVGVVVSAGSPFVEVPDLRGLTADRAKVMLDTIGLRLDDRINQVRDRDIEEGQIVAQTPERGNRVERGTRVRITISSGRNRPEPEPNPTQKYLYTVSIRLTDVLESVNLRVDLTDDRGTRTVHESMQGPEDQVEITAEGYGKEVVFRIFYDGQLVKQLTKRADEDGE